MAVENKICNDCDKSIVCSWCKIIDKFDDEVTSDDLKKIEQYSLLEASLEEEKRKVSDLEALLEIESLYWNKVK